MSAKPPPSVTGIVGKYFGNRPAESLTLAAGAAGLLIAQFVDIEMAAEPLILLLAAIPATTSYVVNRFFEEHSGSAATRHQEVADELEYATARTIRKALLGDPTWEKDQLMLKELWELHPGHDMQSEAPTPPAAPSRDPGEAQA